MKQATCLIAFAIAFGAGCGPHEKGTSPAQDSTAGKVTAAHQKFLLPAKPLPLASAGVISTAPCDEKPTRPEVLPDPRAAATMSAEFNELYETGQFEIGYCVAEVHVNSTGTVDRIRVVRPRSPDKRVVDVIVRRISSRHYRTGIACGRPVAFDVTIGIGHCPALITSSRKSPG